MVDAIKIGVIGFSEGNGHPFSFSSIINGYEPIPAAWRDWEGILSYLKKQDPVDIGVPGARVSHVWTQDLELSGRIAAAARIEHICQTLDEMTDDVDAVVLARDDYEKHYEMAKPFLDAGKHVFIDKPLAVDPEALRYFAPFLASGQLMSCSGLRYARELDTLRATLPDLGDIRLVRGCVVRGWEKYGIHMLDAIFGVLPFRVQTVAAQREDPFSVVLKGARGEIVQIDCLGDSVKTFQIDVWGSAGRFSCEITDNFSAFRRTMIRFVELVRGAKPPIDAASVLDLMKILIAGRISAKEKREVSLEEILL
jgi:hypothetical protein